MVVQHPRQVDITIPPLNCSDHSGCWQANTNFHNHNIAIIFVDNLQGPEGSAAMQGVVQITRAHIALDRVCSMRGALDCLGTQFSALPGKFQATLA